MSKRGQSWDGFEWYLSGNMCKIGEQKWENKNGLPTVATVSSLPWVKTTTRCLFVLSLGRFWVFFAISAMSSVCGVKKKKTPDQYWVSMLSRMKALYGDQFLRSSSKITSVTERGQRFPILADGSSDNKTRWAMKPLQKRSIGALNGVSMQLWESCKILECHIP